MVGVVGGAAVGVVGGAAVGVVGGVAVVVIGVFAVVMVGVIGGAAVVVIGGAGGAGGVAAALGLRARVLPDAALPPLDLDETRCGYPPPPSPDIFYGSVHADPNFEFPYFSGQASETGGGKTLPLPCISTAFHD